MATKTNPENLIRHENGTIELKIRISWPTIEAAFKKELAKASDQVEVPGFRKGKAPKDMIDPKVDRTAALSQSINVLLPEAYSELVKSHQLKPILYPQIIIDKGKEGEDWEFTATTCEAPTVTVPEYKNEISKLKAEEGQSKLTPIIEWLRKNSKVSVPQPLVEEESNHRLSALAENLTQIGLDMTKYLQTKKLSAQDLKAQTLQAAKIDLETEFILAQIQMEQKLDSRAKTLEYLQGMLG